MALALTELTVKQQRRLANIAKDEPLTVVIGWSEAKSGPILKRADDSLVVIGLKGYTYAI